MYLLHYRTDSGCYENARSVVRSAPCHCPYRAIGDGDFSFEENPLHIFPKPGNYSTILDLTSNYDDSKKPRKRKKSVLTGGGTKIAMAAVFPG